MGFSLQFRHPTGGIDPKDYWIGFAAHHTINTADGPTTEVYPVEISGLNLGVPEERRMNGGFSFPFALYRRERYGEHGEHDKTIVTRLYVQIEDAARAFDKVKFISKIELLIGRRAGILAALGMPASVRVYVDESDKPSHELTIDDSLWNFRAVKCELLRADAQGRLNLREEIDWVKVDAFDGDVESYAKAVQDASLERLRAVNRAPARASKDAERVSVDMAPIPATASATSTGSSTRSNATATEGKGRSAIGTSSAPHSASALVTPIPVESSIVRPPAPVQDVPKSPKSRAGRYLLSVAVIGICAMIFWPKSKDSNVAIAEPPMSAAKPTTPAPTPSSANPVPRATPAPEQTWPVPFNGARGPESSAQPSSVNQEPEVPIGNSNIARENLYKFGFDDHLSAVKRTLAASKGLNKTEFDISSEWLRSNRPTPPTWPPADAKLRRIFNERIELLVNHGKTVGDQQELGKAIDLSERFLTSHFGYSTSHLNLSIAQSAFGNGKAALAPAFHTIVFNPDGANGWVALGVALARSGDGDGAANSFCAALRKTKFSEKTVGYFEKVAKGEDLAYAEVTQAMSRTMNGGCPREQWAD